MAISKHLLVHGEGDGDDIPDDRNTWKATDPEDEDDDRNTRSQGDGDGEDESDDKNTKFK